MIEDDSCVRNNICLSAESNFNYGEPTKEGLGQRQKFGCDSKGRTGVKRGEF